MPDPSNLHIRSFLEPTFCLAAITAILYFWGYIYFATFCEEIGVSFNGIEVPLTTHLLVGWQHIFYTAMAISLFLICYENAIWLLKNIAEIILTRIFKRFHKFFEQLFNNRWMNWIDKNEPRGELMKIGIVVFIIILGAYHGSINLIEKAKVFANHQLEEKKSIVIYDTEHKILNGDFVYLMDYGSALIVGELSNDNNVTRTRILKQGSYVAYSFATSQNP